MNELKTLELDDQALMGVVGGGGCESRCERECEPKCEFEVVIVIGCCF